MTYVAPRIAPDVMGVKELGVNVIFRGKRNISWDGDLCCSSAHCKGRSVRKDD